jgi:hypothetical protein
MIDELADYVSTAKPTERLFVVTHESTVFPEPATTKMDY